MRELSIVVPGPPVAMKRPRRGAAGQFYTPRETQQQEELIAWYARAAKVVFGKQAVAVQIVFDVDRPGRFDGDNGEKLVLDALEKAGVYDNDRQVRECRWVVDEAPRGREQTAITVSLFDA